MNKLIVLFSLVIAATAAWALPEESATVEMGQLEFSCEETLAPLLLQVHYELRTNVETGLWENDQLAFDPSLLGRPIAWSEPVEIVIYPKDSVIDGIFQNPLPKTVDEYPEYQEELAEIREEALELYDKLLEYHKGDKEALKQSKIASEISAVQQWEFERNGLLPYLSGDGKLPLKPENFRRVSRYGWKLEGISLKEALIIALLLKSEKTLLDGIQIFAKDSPLTNCSSGSCSIRN